MATQGDTVATQLVARALAQDGPSFIAAEMPRASFMRGLGVKE